MKHKFFKFFRSMLDFNSIKLGLLKAYSVPMLPLKLKNIYNHIYTRILRVIGGLCALLVLTKSHNMLIYPMDWVVLVIALLQLLQIILISTIKTVYGVKLLKNNSKELEVRNSPINNYASLIAKFAYCWKIGCTVAGGSVGIVAGGSAIDQVLEAGGYPKVFLPFMGKSIRIFDGNKVINDPEKFYNDFKTSLKQLENANDRQKFIEKALNKLDSEDLEKYGMTKSESSDVKKAISDLAKENEAEKKSIAANIIKEIEKLGKGK